jgi:cupin fold WbuC family metalloprotein
MSNFKVENIYSKVLTDVLLHQLVYLEYQGLEPFRVNVSPETESLQVALICLGKDQTFKPHYHVNHDRNMPIAQESWVVIRGRVKVIHYDIDNHIIKESILNPGDATITYKGGHNYVSLDDSTVVYELKTGPYLGQKADKDFIV